MEGAMEKDELGRDLPDDAIDVDVDDEDEIEVELEELEIVPATLRVPRMPPRP